MYLSKFFLIYCVIHLTHSKQAGIPKKAKDPARKFEMPKNNHTYCLRPPDIENSDTWKMSRCRDQPLGRLCKVECLHGFEPTKLTVKCETYDPEADQYKGHLHVHSNLSKLEWFRPRWAPVNEKWNETHLHEDPSLNNPGNISHKLSPKPHVHSNKSLLEWVPLHEFERSKIPKGFAIWNTTEAFCKLEVEVVCRDHKDHPVDWFIAYKHNGSSEDAETSDYFLMTDKYFRHYPNGFHIKDSAPSLNHTLLPLNDLRVTYAMYSDQPPTPTSFYYPILKDGYAKGVLAKSGNRGFFLSHSMLNFPRNKHSEIASTWSQKNAEMFLCVTFDADVYWHVLVDYMRSLHPHVYVKQGDWHEKKPVPTSKFNPLSFSILSAGNTSFRLFSKSEWGVTKGKDLFEDVIHKHYGVKLLVSSWKQNEKQDGTLHSDCSKNGVIDYVTNVEYEDEGRPEELYTVQLWSSWPNFKDHSKWAVSLWEKEHPEVEVFCVSDLDGVKSEKGRHGGAVCFENDRRVVKWFRHFVERTECRGRSYRGDLEKMESDMMEFRVSTTTPSYDY